MSAREIIRGYPIVPGPALGGLKSPEGAEHPWVGFDRVVRFSFTAVLPWPRIPPGFDIVELPSGITKAVVSQLGVVGHPLGQFLNRLAWAPRVTKAGAREYVTGSAVETTPVVTSPLDSGMRWGMLGSLTRPAPVNIELGPQVRFGLAIVNVNTVFANVPFTIYARAIGAMYYR